MQFKKIIIKRNELNKQNKDESFFFYLTSWFLAEIKTLEHMYFCSMNMKEAEGLEIYGRNYRTMLIGCLLCSKLYEGWKILQKCYFANKIHDRYKKSYSKDALLALDLLKTYFGKQSVIIKEIRHSTFHYPKEGDERQDFERRLEDTDDNDYSEHFIAETFQNTLFSTDYFVSNVIKKTKARDITEAIKLIHNDIEEVSKSYRLFFSEYIFLFQKKCGFSEEAIEVEKEFRLKDIYYPFFATMNSR